MPKPKENAPETPAASKKETGFSMNVVTTLPQFNEVFVPAKEAVGDIVSLSHANRASVLRPLGYPLLDDNRPKTSSFASDDTIKVKDVRISAPTMAALREYAREVRTRQPNYFGLTIGTNRVRVAGLHPDIIATPIQPRTPRPPRARP
jgi:hypothetical protein